MIRDSTNRREKENFVDSGTVKRKVSPESHCTLFEEGLPFVSKGNKCSMRKDYEFILSFRLNIS